MSVFLFHGADLVFVREAVSDKVRELVGDGDRTLMYQEFDGDYFMAAVTEVAQTPSFLTERRVIVARHVADFDSESISALAWYLHEPSDDSDLILEWGSGRIVKAIADGMKACGGQTIDPSPPNRFEERRTWWEQQLLANGLNLDAPAATLLIEWLGEDVSRLSSLAQTLKSTYGKARINREKLMPFLGERGDVKPWDLTDAVDSGHASKALMAARRLMNAGERHPLQIMAQLHNHYSHLAKLDGVEISAQAEVEKVLGLRGYPAQKALKAFQSLGGGGVRRAFELLAAADLDLRGSTGLEEDVVMDVLVARLAKLTGTVSRQR